MATVATTTRRDRFYDRYATPSAGALLVTYSLALIFLWFGCLKFTQYEAAGIAPLVMNSPLVGWWHSTFGIGGTSRVLGVYEILTGLLLAARPFSAKLASIGGAMATICFLVTCTFMLSTPGVAQPGFDNPLALSAFPGQFLLKDVVLLAVSIWILFAARAGSEGVVKRALRNGMAVGLALLIAGGPAAAADAGHPVVVELFQSPGCSSCPPAITNINAIAGRPDVLALTFAVTYWDQLGWKDTFAKPEFTEREREYASAGRGQVATPQTVVNGSAVTNGGDRAALIDTIRKADRGTSGPSIEGAAGKVTIGRGTTGQPATIWLVRYDARAQRAGSCG